MPPPTAFPEAPTAELPRVSPLTGMANHPLAALDEPATENAEHRPSSAAARGSAPAAGAIVEPTLALHRPDCATAPSAAASGSAQAAGAIAKHTLATHRPDGAIAPGGTTPAG
jgi:hypothetical protein